ncbi:hypothetical protein ScPMuIL_012724 [Solemya velum]
MSLGILTSTIRAVKSIGDHPYIRNIGDGLTTLIKPGTDYKHLTKRKTRLELIRLSAAVCGIELCYAAETAFVSPILLKLGVPVAFMTLVWCISPLLGFFLVPLMGSLSDRCKLKLGRRRPFIIVMSIGVLVGLGLVPNGETFGIMLGDTGTQTFINNGSYATNMSSGRVDEHPSHTGGVGTARIGEMFVSSKLPHSHLIGIVLTIIGVALLDFDCDACQSPCRAYLLDVSVPDDHSPGLTTFTVMAGLGGSVGYAMGGVDWNATTFGAALGGHVRVVFTMVFIVYVLCVISTLTSFKEVPLSEIEGNSENLQKRKKRKGSKKYVKFTNESDNSDDEVEIEHSHNYGTIRRDSVEQNKTTLDIQKIEQNGVICQKYNGMQKSHTNTESNGGTQTLNCSVSNNKSMPESDQQKGTDTDNPAYINDELQINLTTDVDLHTYLWSIVHLPKSLLILCLTNLFCWMSLVCYSLYFTDFVGQSVYGGDPNSPIGSTKHNLYDDGVRQGSFGMALYSVSCAVYSLCIEKLVEKFRAKRVYICGQLAYTFGMVLMALTRNKLAVLLLSPFAGIMYATLFTMPYLLIAHYHTSGQFSPKTQIIEDESKPVQIRGLGTDVALASSMVFLAQFILSAFMGTIIHAAGSTITIVIAAAVLSLCGAISATQVVYLDL